MRRFMTFVLAVCLLMPALALAGDQALAPIGPIQVQAELVEHAPVPWGQKPVIGTYWHFGTLWADAKNAEIEWWARSNYEGYRQVWPYGLARTQRFEWDDAFNGYVAYVPRPDLPASAWQTILLEIDAENATATIKIGVVTATGHFPFWEWSDAHYWQIENVVPQFMEPRAQGGDRHTPGE